MERSNIENPQLTEENKRKRMEIPASNDVDEGEMILNDFVKQKKLTYRKRLEAQSGGAGKDDQRAGTDDP